MAKEKINFEDEQVRLRYRHTTSHIMAQAVKKLWPDTKLAIGPAIEFMADKGEDYKVELIEDLPEDEVISFYRQGDFVDLCAGPHMDRTGQIKAVKLQSVAGAYWRGDSDRQMLQRKPRSGTTGR